MGGSDPGQASTMVSGVSNLSMSCFTAPTSVSASFVGLVARFLVLSFGILFFSFEWFCRLFHKGVVDTLGGGHLLVPGVPGDGVAPLGGDGVVDVDLLGGDDGQGLTAWSS